MRCLIFPYATNKRAYQQLLSAFVFTTYEVKKILGLGGYLKKLTSFIHIFKSILMYLCIFVSFCVDIIESSQQTLTKYLSTEHLKI